MTDSAAIVRVTAAGRGQAEVELVVDGHVVEVDVLRVASAEARADLVACWIAKRPGLDAAELEALLVREAARLADERRKADETANSGQSTTRLQGRAVELTVPEPWPEPVDGATLLDETAATVRRYIVLPRAAVTACALWILHTYVYDVFGVTPRLAITSPVMRCGKTKLRAVLAALVAKPFTADNISTAVLFRVVERQRPTILLDEVDRLFAGRSKDETKTELIGLMNAGHSASGMVYRCTGDEHEVRGYSVFAPLALFGIGRMPDTIEDRSVKIVMQRRRPGDGVAPLRLDRIDRDLEPIRRRAVRWAADHRAELSESDPTVPDGLDDRAADNWRPLLAIADLVGGEWLTSARDAALELSGVRTEDDPNLGIMLLADLRALFDARGASRLATDAILTHLHGLTERPWREWGRRAERMTSRQLASVMKPYEVRSRDLWLAGAATKGYQRQDLEDAWSRYLSPSRGGSDPQCRETPATARPAGQHVSAREGAPRGCVLPSAPSNGAGSRGIADQRGGDGQVEDLGALLVAARAALDGDPAAEEILAQVEVEQRQRVAAGQDPAAVAAALRAKLAAAGIVLAPPDTPSDAPDCYACGGRAWWRARDGREICRRCYPPAPGAEVVVLDG